MKPSPPYALQALNCCPGLLCFVTDRKGFLLHATRGYREIAGRFLGHGCVIGQLYPPEYSSSYGGRAPIDADLREVVLEAFRGGTSHFILTEPAPSGGNNTWRVTGAPLLSSGGELTGAVVTLTPIARQAERVPQAAQTERDALDFFDMLDDVPDMLFVADGDGRCVTANEKFLRVTKFPREAVAGHLFEEFLLKGDPVNEGFHDALLKALRGSENSFEDLECKAAGGEGDVLWLSLCGTRLQREKETRVLVRCADIARLRRTEEHLRRVSVTDASTGTLNRQGMERVLTAETERAARYNGALSMIMLDVDGFRQLNERLGYAASDRVLKDLAAEVKSRLGMTDFLGRWGGDEFMILTPAPSEAAARLAERIRDMAEHMTFGANRTERLTLSAGAAGFHKSMDVSAFAGAAYDAMIGAKKLGGNRAALAPEKEFEKD